MKMVQQEAEELKAQVSQMEKQLHCLQTELDSQKDANVCQTRQTMKNLVESLKAQLCLKEKQQKVVSVTLSRDTNQIFKQMYRLDTNYKPG